MKIQDVKEFTKKKLTVTGDGYFLFRKMIAAGGIVYWDRLGIFPASQVEFYKRKKGFKTWNDLTEEEKGLVNIFPDSEIGTPNTEHMSKIARQSSDDAKKEMEAKLSGKHQIVVNVDDALIEKASQKKGKKSE